MTTLRVTVKRAEGALVRVLGLVSRRGFEIERAVVRPSADGRAMEVTMTLGGARPGDVLARQVGRLYDVMKVEVA